MQDLAWKEIHKNSQKYGSELLESFQYKKNNYPVVGDIDIEAFINLSPPRNHKPIPIQGMTSPPLALTIMLDVSASVNAKQLFLSYTMLFVLLRSFPNATIIAFSTKAHLINNTLGQGKLIFQKINHLVQPAYTNICSALHTAWQQPKPHRTIHILISDGVANYGKNPTRNDGRKEEIILFSLSKEPVHWILPYQIFPLYQESDIPLALEGLEDYIFEYAPIWDSS